MACCAAAVVLIVTVPLIRALAAFGHRDMAFVISQDPLVGNTTFSLMLALAGTITTPDVWASSAPMANAAAIVVNGLLALPVCTPAKVGST